MIRVTCPTCGDLMNLQDSMAGRRIRCGDCQTLIRVPDAEPPEAVRATEPFGIGPPKPTPRSGIGGKTILGIALIPIALIGICCGGLMMVTGVGKRFLFSGGPASPSPAESAKEQPPPAKPVSIAPVVTITPRVDPAPLPSPRPQAKKDPSTELRLLVELVQKAGTRERVTDFQFPGRWNKRRYLIDKIRITHVSDATASLEWTELAYLTDFFGSQEEAEIAPLPRHPKTAGKLRHWATLAWDGGRWRPLNLGWRMVTLDLECKHSTLKDFRDPVHDWWMAFGGD